MLPASLWADLQPHTLECILALEVTTTVLQRDSNEPVDHEVNNALKPVLLFCHELAKYTQQLSVHGGLSTDHSKNLGALREHISMGVEGIMRRYPDCFKDTSIYQLFGEFYDQDELPELLGGHESVTEHGQSITQQTVAVDEEEDLQRALQASLEEFQVVKNDAVDQQQREIQEYYASMGGNDSALQETLGDTVGRSDVPSLKQALQQIPADGITFKELTRLLNIFNLDREVLQHLADGLFSYATVKNGTLYPAQPTESDGRLPSDERVKETLFSSNNMDMLTLFKVLHVRELGPEACLQFEHGLLSRKIVYVNEDGWLRVVAQSRSASAIYETPVSRTSVAAEHHPSSVPSSVASDLPAPGLVSMAKLPGEIVRIRAAVLAHLRQWQNSFPRPRDCTYPELKPDERSTIMRHITSYVQLNNLLDAQKPDELGHLIDELQTNQHKPFPIARGNNVQAVTAAVKIFYQDYNKKQQQVGASRLQASDNSSDEGDGSDPGVRGDRGGLSRARHAKPGSGKAAHPIEVVSSEEEDDSATPTAVSATRPEQEACSFGLPIRGRSGAPGDYEEGSQA